MRELPFVLGCAAASAMLLLPVAWHVRSRNAGTMLYIAWSLTGNLIYLVNSIVWAGNVRDPAPIWCDITSKLIIGLTVGLPCASLCIQRRLYLLSRVSASTPSPANNKRALGVDLLIGLGIPVMVMAFHFIVQDHRYNILEDVGCWPAVYMTALSIPLVFVWPILVSIVSIPYAVLSYRSFSHRRAEFQRYLAPSESGMNADRYLRLMALASMELLVVLPLNLLSLVANLQNNKLQPWTGWDGVHHNFDRVAYVYRWVMELNRTFWVEFQISRWAIPASGLLFFIFFGLSIEARKDYARAYQYTIGGWGVKPPQQPTKPRSSATLMLKRSNLSRTSTPFTNDDTLTALPTYARRTRHKDSLSLKAGDTISVHTTTPQSSAIKVPPLQIPDTVYRPRPRPSLSHSDLAEEGSACHTRSSSTAFLLQESPLSATSNSSWNKPLPPVPTSRPVSQATATPCDIAHQREESTIPACSREATVDAANIADGDESVYYTPAAYRLSLMSAEYQPSIPDIPEARCSSKSRKARPQYPF